MAQITIDIPNDVLPRIIDAFVFNYGYQDRIADPDNPGETISNPQSHEDFMIEQVKKFLTDNTCSYETNLAMQEAASTVTRIAF